MLVIKPKKKSKKKIIIMRYLDVDDCDINIVSFLLCKHVQFDDFVAEVSNFLMRKYTFFCFICILVIVFDGVW